MDRTILTRYPVWNKAEKDGSRRPTRGNESLGQTVLPNGKHRELSDPQLPPLLPSRSVESIGNNKPSSQIPHERPLFFARFLICAMSHDHRVHHATCQNHPRRPGQKTNRRPGSHEAGGRHLPHGLPGRGQLGDRHQECGLPGNRQPIHGAGTKGMCPDDHRGTQRPDRRGDGQAAGKTQIGANGRHR